MARIEQAIEVNVPLQAAYNQWTQFEEFPRFMDGVKEVHQLDDAHLHWRANRNGRMVEWDSEITDQVPDQQISWRDTSGPRHTGSISFRPLREDSTQIRISMEIEPPPGEAGAVNTQEAIAERLSQDLERFKRLIESSGHESGAWRGEIHHAQPVHAQQAGQAEQSEQAGQADAGSRPPQERQPKQTQQYSEPAQTPGGSADTGTGKTTGRTEGEQRDAGQASGQDTGGAGRSGPQAWLRNQFQGWDDPMAMMRKMTEEMDQLFERFIGRPMASRMGQGGAAGKWMPPIEIMQRDSELVIAADLPGIGREDVQIEIEHNKVIIEGERRESQQSATPAGFRRSERSYGHFYRMIPLPEGIDPDSARASMHDGVLEIVLPMPASTMRRGRRIDIGSGS